MTLVHSYCLSHGRLHTFAAKEDAQACTATRIHLEADTREAAAALKEKHLHDVSWFEDLPASVQLMLVERPRRKVTLTAEGKLS